MDVSDLHICSRVIDNFGGKSRPLHKQHHVHVLEPVVHGCAYQAQGHRCTTIFTWYMIIGCADIVINNERASKRQDLGAGRRGVFKLAETVPHTWCGEGDEGETLKVGDVGS